MQLRAHLILLFSLTRQFLIVSYALVPAGAKLARLSLRKEFARPDSVRLRGHNILERMLFQL